MINQNDPKELLSPEEYEELKLEIFRERKISTEVVNDIKLTDEEVQAIRKKTKERRQVFHSKTEKEITERWAFEEGVSFDCTSLLWLFAKFLIHLDQATLFPRQASGARAVEKLEKLPGIWNWTRWRE